MLPRQQHVLDALNSCLIACEHLALTGLELPELHRGVRLSRDCADLCRLTATFVMRQAEHTVHILRECAELCRSCADECTQFSNEAARTCTETCRRAEDACRTAFITPTFAP
ncbi:four-helix bundle copper-binding protein [Hymenobacter taeanensis]|uniref:Four-helix bundle copper-binding protein n=1 Tax=Hymenobacter taeanensis TaxID=2735321 RepID=A0A6M6BLV7_9BACT|nr:MULTISPECIES: four-helix bundle copper-binding protein [Hymenobacter]QJX48969.1 four-helix bundle copper-binding protein [Hymenobacter taeanensis]UOQ81516.1 four-helix bundle copper-binding protein [Hymenobacter sp. 5414T-23]